MVEHATEFPKGTQFISPARERWVKIRVSESRRDDTNMPQTYAANFVHCIFSTKDRRDLIPETLQEKLYAYLFGIAKNLRITIIAVGGTANHIHLLISLPPSLPLAEAIQKLKANSSRWLGEQGMRFEWQKGYDAFSVSPSLLTTVQIYIRNQQQHHRKRSFEEEFLALLRKSAIAHDADRLFAA
jgi:putative transposase